MGTIQSEKSDLAYSGFDDLSALRAQFEEAHYFKLSQLLGPGLLEFLQTKVSEAEFYERVHDGIGANKELCMVGNAAIGALLCAFNDEKLFQMIQTITRCEKINCFEGRVYRIEPGPEHYDSWHNDLGDHRLVAMSVNLSEEIYSGGVLQIRDVKTQKLVSEVANVGIGDAVVFRLSPDLQHRITSVTGQKPKTAFAGWFKAEPTFATLLRQQAKRGRNGGGD